MIRFRSQPPMRGACGAANGGLDRLTHSHVNHTTLVRQGWCWWYRKYAPGDTALEKLETEAREGRKGLWADPQPVPPWEWRKRKR